MWAARGACGERERDPALGATVGLQGASPRVPRVPRVLWLWGETGVGGCGDK